MDMRFSGINLHSSNPAKTLDFYKALGLTVLEEPAPDDKWYGARLALTDEEKTPVIWIWRRGENEADYRNHIVFDAVEGLEAVYARLCAAGISCEPPFTAAWGGRELVLCDPDGNEVLFL